MKEWELPTETAKTSEVRESAEVWQPLLSALHLFHFLHHFFHLSELFQKLVDILHMRS